MNCPNCKQKITQWENSWGRGNAKCILCNKEFNVRMDDHGQFVASSIEPEQCVEPSGISGARELFSDACLHWLAGRSAREKA